MCKENEIAQETVNEFIAKGSFIYSDLLKDIKRRGGILRIMAGYTIKDFCQDLIDGNVLEYNYNNDRFNTIV